MRTLDHIPTMALMAICAQDWLHDQSRAGAVEVTLAPTHIHTHIHARTHTPHPYRIVSPRALAKGTTGMLPLGKSLEAEMDEWRATRGFWADNGSNSSWACCMQVQMQVTHRTSPAFKPPKSLQETCPGSTSDSGASMTEWLPPELNAWSGFENSRLSVILWQSQRQEAVSSLPACACQASGLTLGGRDAQFPENEMLIIQICRRSKATQGTWRTHAGEAP